MKLKLNQYIFILLFLGASIVLMITILAQAVTENDYVEMKVKPGDTLWGYAETFKGEHHLSNTEFVSWVENHNNVSSESLSVGEKLILPIKKENFREVAQSGRND